MFVDLWIVSLFSLLFGGCAWWNFNAGVKKGIESTLIVLAEQKVIRIEDDEVFPYSKGENNV